MEQHNIYDYIRIFIHIFALVFIPIGNSYGIIPLHGGMTISTTEDQLLDRLGLDHFESLIRQCG